MRPLPVARVAASSIAGAVRLLEELARHLTDHVAAGEPRSLRADAAYASGQALRAAAAAGILCQRLEAIAKVATPRSGSAVRRKPVTDGKKGRPRPRRGR